MRITVTEEDTERRTYGDMRLERWAEARKIGP